MDDDDRPPKQTRTERRRAFAVRLLVAGLVLFTLSPIVAGATGNGTGAFAFAAPGMIALVVAVLVAVTGRLFVPALVVGVLLFLISSFASLNELGHPESFSDFVPALLRLVGSATAVAAGVGSLVQSRRRTLRPATDRQRTLVRVGAVALLLVPLASFVVTGTARTTIERADGAIVVDTSGDEFTPAALHVEPGRIRFLVRNDDAYAHTFSVDELEVDEYIGPRSDRFVAITVEAAGRYDLYCAINGHEGMTGTVVVTQDEPPR